MCISDLLKVLMYELNYAYIKINMATTQGYYWWRLIITEHAYEHFSKDEEMFDCSNYSAESKYHEDWNKLVGKMKDKTAGAVIKEFLWLKSRMYCFLVDNSSEHKKKKNVNNNVVKTKIHDEYRNVLLNNKWLRHSMNRVQSKNHGIKPMK